MVEIGSVAASCGASDVELSFAGRRGAAYRFAALPIEEKRLEPGALIFATQDCLGLRPLLVRAADEADGADLWRKAREMGASVVLMRPTASRQVAEAVAADIVSVFQPPLNKWMM